VLFLEKLSWSHLLDQERSRSNGYLSSILKHLTSGQLWVWLPPLLLGKIVQPCQNSSLSELTYHSTLFTFIIFLTSPRNTQVSHEFFTLKFSLPFALTRSFFSIQVVFTCLQMGVCKQLFVNQFLLTKIEERIWLFGSSLHCVVVTLQSSLTVKVISDSMMSFTILSYCTLHCY